MSHPWVSHHALITCLVPHALVEAPALTDGNTVVPSHQVAPVALAAFSTVSGALGDVGGRFATGGTSAGTEFIVAVGWAFHS